ncbi:helix-turn-helix domain-containing protein [Streptomyces sp. NBC_00224]|uniref:Helix-turn-helix domain-containing protein n=2 Tax=Streptomyces TaxID=1883 RepID=A0AAU2HDT6_9ACTN
MKVIPGEVVRQARKARGLTLVQLGEVTGYSAAQVSRYERGVSSMGMDVRWGFARALDIPPQTLGLSPPPGRRDVRHGQPVAPIAAYPQLPASTVVGPGWEDGDDPVRRRNLLANLAVTAAAAAGAPLTGSTPQPEEPAVGELLVGRLRDAMLGIGPAEPLRPSEQLDVELSRAMTDFHACKYASLSVRLPRLIRSGHSAGVGHEGILTQAYTLATRLLVKLDEQQIGWMAADRARQLAESTGNVLAMAEAARNLAVLARKAGWNTEAMSIALAAADDPGLSRAGRDGKAERGLLIQSAAYTAARSGDPAGMRQLTEEALSIARQLGGVTMLRDHGGGFAPVTVQLHLVSAENSAGDPSAALNAARRIVPQALPTVERRARYYTDVATALAHWGRRDDCVRALLAAEHHAPEETHTRPAVKSMVAGLLVSGRTTSELRGLAARCGVLH